MENRDRGQSPLQEESLHALWKNPESAQKVVHALLGGKHVDAYMAEEFRFLENHPSAWEGFFRWLGYRLKRSELGGNPFFYLEPTTEMVQRSKLSRGSTFLGLYLAWHFFVQGPGQSDIITAAELFRRLVNSFKFNSLRSVFIRKTGNLNQLEFSEDQAEKLRGYIRKELAELAKYRFIDIEPNTRAAWEDLTLHRLPALFRFWELALHVQSHCGDEQEPDIEQVVSHVWGSVELETDEDEA